MSDYLNKKNLSKFTRKEFLAFVSHLFSGEAESEEADNINVRHFKNIVPHPAKSDLIFWPPEGIETPEDVVNEIEKYCKEKELPCFKT